MINFIKSPWSNSVLTLFITYLCQLNNNHISTTRLAKIAKSCSWISFVFLYLQITWLYYLYHYFDIINGFLSRSCYVWPVSFNSFSQIGLLLVSCLFHTLNKSCSILLLPLRPYWASWLIDLYLMLIMLYVLCSVNLEVVIKSWLISFFEHW